MSEMQTKILRAVRTTVANADTALEVLEKPKWANNGSLYIQPRDGFDTRLVVDYDFQDSRAHLHLVVLDHTLAKRLAPELEKAGMRYVQPGVMAGASCTETATNEATFYTPVTYTDGASIQRTLEAITVILNAARA